MLTKNKLTKEQLQHLPEAIKSFCKESCSFDEDKFTNNTLSLISLGLQNKIHGHLWIAGNIDLYALCRLDVDSDGELMYVAYQLWINPKNRSLSKVKSFIRFLKFYCQKEKIKRLYVTSSRIDSIEAYGRGLGQDFKETHRIFKKEFN